MELQEEVDKSTIIFRDLNIPQRVIDRLRRKKMMVKTWHFILTVSTRPFYFLFSLSLLARFFQQSVSAQHTKHSLYSQKWGIDKPKGLRWDRFLVLSGISEIQFSKGLWPGLQRHVWTTGFYDLLANQQLSHTDESQKRTTLLHQDWLW